MDSIIIEIKCDPKYRLLNKLREQGVVFIYKVSKIKILLGGICLVIAIVPNGLGLIFYPLGFALLTSAGVDIYELIQSNKRKIKFLWWGVRKRLKC